jgi:hypothetical protein
VNIGAAEIELSADELTHIQDAASGVAVPTRSLLRRTDEAVASDATIPAAA